MRVRDILVEVGRSWVRWAAETDIVPGELRVGAVVAGVWLAAALGDVGLARADGATETPEPFDPASLGPPAGPLPTVRFDGEGGWRFK